MKEFNVNITKKDIIWNYLGNIFNFGMNIFIIPIIIAKLSNNELGLWYLFLAISGFAGLLDFGMSPTISRSVTMAWCGAKYLKKEGYEKIEGVNPPNYILLKSLSEAAQKMYLKISLILLMFLLIIGTYYIKVVTKSDIYNISVISWIIYSISIFLNMYNGYWQSFLKGIGKIEKINKTVIKARIVYITISVLGLSIGAGLLALSISTLISGIIMRYLFMKDFYNSIEKEYFNIHIDKLSSVSNNIIKIIFPNAAKYGLVSIGGFLSQKANIFLCTYYLGIGVTSSYGLTMQLFEFLGNISQLLFSTYYSKMTANNISNEEKNTYYLGIILVSQLVISIIGCLFIIFLFPFLIGKLSNTIILLPKYILIGLSIILVLEWNTAIFINYTTTKNSIPFLNNSIASGLLIIVISYIVMRYFDLGFWSLVVGRAIIGFLYNNWYWPCFVGKKYNINIYKLYKNGLFILLGRYKETNYDN